jgi:phage gp29-like protein
MSLFGRLGTWASARLGNRKSEIVDPKSSPMGRFRSAPAPATMESILKPSARERWMGPAVAHYTPATVRETMASALSGNLVSQWHLFDLMEGTEPRIASNLATLKQALLVRPFVLQPHTVGEQAPTAEAIRRKQIVAEALRSFDNDPALDQNDWEDLLRDLADAWGKGISVQELNWTAKSHTGGTIIGLQSSRWMHPRFYGYSPLSTDADVLRLNLSALLADNPAAEVVMERMAREGVIRIDGDWATLPPDKYLAAVAKAKTGHPTAGALMRPLAWWWALSNFAGDWLVTAAQMFAVPIRWATYAQNTPANQIKLIEEMLAEMGSATWGAFPEGTDLQLKPGPAFGADHPNVAVLTAAHRAFDLAILGHTSESAGVRGSELANDRKRAFLEWAAGVLNTQIVPTVCRLNFGDTDAMPYFVAAEPSAKDWLAKAKRFKAMLNMGLPVSRRYYYDTMGIPQPAPGERVVGQQISRNESEGPQPEPGAPSDNGAPTTGDWTA